MLFLLSTNENQQIFSTFVPAFINKQQKLWKQGNNRRVKPIR